MENEHYLNLIRNLLISLEESGVKYCHWKSNAALDRSANGENDIDVLVDRQSSERFTQILNKLGFKLAIPPDIKKMPGILDYYGYDQESDRFVHVHTHYQLVVGQDFTKNYHIPIEKPFIESSIRQGLFKIPSPEFELILFVIRMVIKHATWDTILSGMGKLSPSEKIELEDLVQRADKAQVRKILNLYLPNINGELFTDCLRAIQTGCPLMKRIVTGERLQRSLKAMARRPWIADIFLKIWRRAVLTAGIVLFKRRYSKRLINGGLVIAIIGGDGAGKTTVVNGLTKWLSRHFMTRKFHLGKPRWSAATIFVRGMIKMGRMIGLYPFENELMDEDNAQWDSYFPGYPSLIRSVCTARDRYLMYKKARRFASRGGLVISDRFPLPYLSNMESPQIIRFKDKIVNKPIFKYLAKLEMRYYKSILIPEIVLVLRVDPLIAIDRKPEDGTAYVQRRSSEIWDFDWNQTSAHVIDAGQNPEEVLKQVKSAVWSNL